MTHDQQIEADIAYGYSRTWSPPASPSRDHYMNNLKPRVLQTAKSRVPDTTSQGARKKMQRSSSHNTAKTHLDEIAQDEERMSPSKEADKIARLNELGVNHGRQSPAWAENGRWGDCGKFGEDAEIQKRSKNSQSSKAVPPQEQRRMSAPCDTLWNT